MDKFLSNKKRKDNSDRPISEPELKKTRSETLGIQSPQDISQRAGEKLSRPLLKTYPKHSEGKSHARSFVASWYDRYNWVEYSQESDAMFCFPCRHFSHPGYGNMEEAFTKTGFRRWKKAHGKDGAIDKHVNSQCHKAAAISWNDFERNKASHTSVEQVLSENYRRKVAENRHYIKTIGEIILITATQNIAQRGHRECDDIGNPGNVRKLLQFAAKHDPVVADRIKSGPKNEKYTSHSIQNENIETFATMVSEEMTESIKKACYFSIQADESKDLRKTEQLSLVIRFFDEDSYTIEERFISFIPMHELDAKSMSTAIMRKLEKLGLDYKGCLVGMGFDGARVMSGRLSGVQKRIQDEAPMAYYVHCYGHRLNLVLVETVKTIPQADDFFALLEQLYIFVSNSVVHERFISMQKEMYPGQKPRELQNLSVTRWWARATSCNNALICFECIMQLLREISETDKGVRATTARGLLIQMDFDFLRLLHFFKDILTQVNRVSEQLQDPTLDLSKACNLISALKEEMDYLRSSDLQSYSANAEELCRKCSITIDKTSQRPRSSPAFLGDSVVADAIGKSGSTNPEMPFQTNVLYPILDCMLSELNTRFSNEAKDIMRGISALSPTSETFLKYEELQDMASKYHICQDGLIHEICLVKRLVTKHCSTIHDFLVQICPYKQAFDCIYKLLLISVTLPVTTASCERSFSKMKLVKTFLRNSMCNERLSNLALLSIESKLAESIDLDNFIDEFDARHENRRIKLH